MIRLRQNANSPGERDGSRGATPKEVASMQDERTSGIRIRIVDFICDRVLRARLSKDPDGTVLLSVPRAIRWAVDEKWLQRHLDVPVRVIGR
jgi:hypothetical protein